MSDTPETDAFLRDLNDYSDVELRAMTEHARRLEQERNEARVHWGTESMNAAQFFGEKTKAIAERDEAREQYDDLATEHILAVNKICNERDEARQELNDIRLNLGADADGYTLLHAVCAVQNERDEARAELDAYREVGHHCDSHRDMMGDCIVCSMEEKK